MGKGLIEEVQQVVLKDETGGKWQGTETISLIKYKEWNDFEYSSKNEIVFNMQDHIRSN